MVPSFVTFFNGRVDTQRRAQREIRGLCVCVCVCVCVFNLLFYFLGTFVLCLEYFWAHFFALRPKALCSEVVLVCFSHIKRQRKSSGSYFSSIC